MQDYRHGTLQVVLAFGAAVLDVKESQEYPLLCYYPLLQSQQQLDLHRFAVQVCHPLHPEVIRPPLLLGQMIMNPSESLSSGLPELIAYAYDHQGHL